jgi:hypothetical protein
MLLTDDSNDVYTRSFPCAAKRVRNRSSGYVTVVAAAPAAAPLTNDVAALGRAYGSGIVSRRCDIDVYDEN